MAINVLRTAVTSLLSRAKHELRRPNCKRLLTFSRRAAAIIPFIGGAAERRRNKKLMRKGEEEDVDTSSEEFDGEEEEEVWRRGIIMGEKCEPLDFPGAIYYDCDGRQLAEVPVARSPMRSPLPSFLADGKSWK